MYKNLEVELVKRGISKSTLAKRLGIAPPKRREELLPLLFFLVVCPIA